MRTTECVLNEKDSTVNGTDDREAQPKRWVAALVQMKCEKKVADRLTKLGYEVYVPIQREEHQWSDRKKMVDRIIMPMVVFVRLAQNEEDEFRKLSFILKFITYPGSKELATPIPDEQIDRLKFLLENAESEVIVLDNLRIGDSVKVSNGPLKGLEGVVAQIGNKKDLVAVRIDGLGYACVSVEKINLELK